MYQRDQIEDPITCLVHKVAETKIRAILSRIPHFKAWMKNSTRCLVCKNSWS